jgi:hypothetical protein
LFEVTKYMVKYNKRRSGIKFSNHVYSAYTTLYQKILNGKFWKSLFETATHYGGFYDIVGLTIS